MVNPVIWRDFNIIYLNCSLAIRAWLFGIAKLFHKLWKIVPLPNSYKSESTCMSTTNPREVSAKKLLDTYIPRDWAIKQKPCFTYYSSLSLPLFSLFIWKSLSNSKTFWMTKILSLNDNRSLFLFQNVDQFQEQFLWI